MLSSVARFESRDRPEIKPCCARDKTGLTRPKGVCKPRALGSFQTMERLKNTFEAFQVSRHIFHTVNRDVSHLETGHQIGQRICSVLDTDVDLGCHFSLLDLSGADWIRMVNTGSKRIGADKSVKLGCSAGWTMIFLGVTHFTRQRCIDVRT